jgi:transglutaminase-like putative cysteine protease
MRAHIRYEIQLAFAEPARALTHLLRLTPRGFDSQYVQDWRVGVEPDARLRRTEDSFGNIVHACSHDGPIERLNIFAEGEIETSDAAGVVHGQIERFPLDVFLRDAEPTRADSRMHAFVADCFAGETDPLGRMHALMDAVHKTCAFAPGETLPRPATEVFAAGKGSARELAQVFIACARSQNVPARFISGFFLGDIGNAGAHHAWAEVFIEPYGWVGFDCAFDLCPQGEYLRIALGLDYYGAALRRSAFFGVAKEKAAFSLDVDQARQASWQAQQ